MDAELTKKVIEEMTEDYNLVYKQMGFIPEVYARVRASNGIMVELTKMKDYIKTVITKADVAAPTLQKSDNVATAAPPAEPPKPVPAAPIKTLDDIPDSIPSPGTKPTAEAERVATENQVNAIRKFCETPKLKQFVAETLRRIGKGSAGQLSFSEAFDLIAKLYDMQSGKIPLGAKVDVGAKT